MDNSIGPFLRWAGGKRWLAPVLSDFIKARLSESGRYFEPFLGSAAVFFASQPKRAFLSDLNEDLILTYRILAEHPRKLITKLSRLPSDAATYYRVRASRPKSELGHASRFIYLNRNCYRGIYRENKKGKFNVPFGGGDRNHFGICSDGTLLSCSGCLASPHIEMNSGDFEQFIRLASAGDVVYCDPTYRKVAREHFDRYGRTIFSWNDQRRLAEACASAHRRGATIIISNACCEDLMALYPNAAILHVVRKPGIVSLDGRLSREEYLLILDSDCLDDNSSRELRETRFQIGYPLFKTLPSRTAIKNQRVGL